MSIWDGMKAEATEVESDDFYLSGAGVHLSVSLRVLEPGHLGARDKERGEGQQSLKAAKSGLSSGGPIPAGTAMREGRL